MDVFVQQIVSGLATGGIYGSVALALVMIYQATDVVNYAQGEMAMFSTYLAWTMLNAGLPYWVAFFGTLLVSFVGGLLLERIVIRPVEGAPVLTIVIVCIGLLVILNSIAGWIYSYIQKPFPTPFPSTPIRIGNVYFGTHDLGALGVGRGLGDGDPGPPQPETLLGGRYVLEGIGGVALTSLGVVFTHPIALLGLQLLLRRFWAADHRLRWHYTALGGVIVCMLAFQAVGDVQALLS